MAEPTSALTFSDLILEVARKMGVAYYGSDGTGVTQIPTDAFALAECKRLVNNGIRMFINDAPDGGWNWTVPTASFVIWPDYSVTATRTVSGGTYSGGATTLTANTSIFTQSMEMKDIVITGVGTFTIASYISATQVSVTGNASAASGSTYSISSGGNFTLPSGYGGARVGPINYAANTNRGISIMWVDEIEIRRRRENQYLSTGVPFVAAITQKLTGTPRRRYEMMVFPAPDRVYTFEFAYELHFDSLVNLTDTPPSPFLLDEAVKAACLCAVELDVEDGTSQHTTYYRDVALPQAIRKDARAAPSRLGYFGNGKPAIQSIQDFRRNVYLRPIVTY